MNIRNSAKAVILKNSELLLTKNIDDEGIFYLFPGGGQEHGEKLIETVKRECLEEVGASIEVKELLHIREYIGKNHEYVAFDASIHQIEYYFLCVEALDQTEFLLPTNPDSHQIGVEWIPVKNLQDYRIYPRAMIQPIHYLAEGRNSPVYLGDVN